MWDCTVTEDAGENNFSCDRNGCHSCNWSCTWNNCTCSQFVLLLRHPCNNPLLDHFRCVCQTFPSSVVHVEGNFIKCVEAVGGGFGWRRCWAFCTCGINILFVFWFLFFAALVHACFSLFNVWWHHPVWSHKRKKLKLLLVLKKNVESRRINHVNVGRPHRHQVQFHTLDPLWEVHSQGVLCLPHMIKSSQHDMGKFKTHDLVTWHVGSVGTV